MCPMDLVARNGVCWQAKLPDLVCVSFGRSQTHQVAGHIPPAAHSSCEGMHMLAHEQHNISGHEPTGSHAFRTCIRATCSNMSLAFALEHTKIDRISDLLHTVQWTMGGREIMSFIARSDSLSTLATLSDVQLVHENLPGSGNELVKDRRRHVPCGEADNLASSNKPADPANKQKSSVSRCQRKPVRSPPGCRALRQTARTARSNPLIHRSGNELFNEFLVRTGWDLSTLSHESSTDQQRTPS